MTSIVAVGGGEIGRTEILADSSIKRHPVETLEIEKEMIRLTFKQNPTVVFLPTASGDSVGYCDAVDEHFGKRLGCKVKHLRLTDDRPVDNIEEIISTADIVYVGGGNTYNMFDIWQKNSIDKILQKVFYRDIDKKYGIVLAGISAGAVCWFDFYDNKDNEKIDSKFELKLFKGLELIKGFSVPHYETFENEEKIKLKRLALDNNIKDFYGLDNCSAMIIETSTSPSTRFMSVKNNRSARKLSL
ncbi:MAG: Type 1 glutamine amidotransferase-like domain-containing protein [Alphaproteobacteria bacterium]|nr:Type 1 glutamine amidotransferase-like domain-containing protein [Alphaproteobacteria bacterium]